MVKNHRLLTLSIDARTFTRSLPKKERVAWLHLSCRQSPILNKLAAASCLITKFTAAGLNL